MAFGVSAGQRPWLGELGEALGGLGYDELWSNDVPGASGLDTLAAVADATDRLRLAVGVIALSGASPNAIAERVATAGLPAIRLTVGVGSGSGRSLDAVRRGCGVLRGLLPDYAIGLAAVGPRMAELGGAVADVVLLNWAGPRLAS
ncbi:MAG: LLM class flavin-dependent oxidoreductase, partial [Candidatus Rokuibacteriota bacterium]